MNQKLWLQMILDDLSLHTCLKGHVRVYPRITVSKLNQNTSLYVDKATTFSKF